MMMCLCRFILGKECALRVGRGCVEISEAPSQFCLSLKLLFKIKFFFKSQVKCLKKYF